jgi:imidazolonepropionase-like amidohydrolase
MRPISLFITPLALIAALPAASQVQGDPSAWRNTPPEQPAALVVRNATIWTSGPQGRLEEADLLVRRGRVAAVGIDLEAPGGAVEIDATGKHVTPGLIDAHSHTAIQGGVNEGSNVVTAEVRIADVVQPESINIYRQLAGGLTVANMMHGSANAIGGHNGVIKLRWGAPPGELLAVEAAPGIKFALGENPKQSNFNRDERRYPQTRMGVEQVIRERFRAALDYRREWQQFEAGSGRDRVPPRRDLQLETLVEILEGRRDVHSHSYRADEILMLMRVAEDLGFRIRCFQHVLEGYKVADELAAHGAGASTFSDWWAYKYEVIDAIPYNGAIMENRGVVVSFNSDSSELARRLNLEAAKAVRYGGVPEEEALKFVTLNPAIQLGAERRIGSLEPGKDADFVIWNGSPLSTYSVAEQTWIDGRRYFDRDQDLDMRQLIAAERDTLLKKVRAKKELDEAPDPGAPEPEGADTEAGADPAPTEPPEPPEPPSHAGGGRS